MTRAIEKLCLLYPQDRRFEKRNRVGDSRCPVSTEDGRYPASCFLYEANLQLSDQLGERLVHPEAEVPSLQARDITIVRRYLEAINAEVPLTQQKSGPKNSRKNIQKKTEWLSERELHKGRMVVHKTLGIGTVKSVGRAQGVVTVDFSACGLQNLVINLARLRSTEA